MSREYTTEEEQFWAGEFGEAYQERNEGDHWIAANLAFFGRALKSAGRVESLTELGPNIGLNLTALQRLLPAASLRGVEISDSAIDKLKENVPGVDAVRSSILDWEPEERSDLVFTKGVLIHINPDALPTVYDKIHEGSRKYILLAEYFNPVPEMIPYRGHENRLYKRDFAGEMLDRFPDLALRDYGFAWRRDPLFPQGDLTWFLLEKTGTEAAK